MKKMFPLFAIVVLALSACSSIPVSEVCKTPLLPSHPIVGCWESKVAGEGWVAPSVALKGDLFLNVEKVVGSEVEGKVYVSGPAIYHNQWLSFKGTLDKQTLSFQISSFIIVNLSVSDNYMEMAGYGMGTVRSEINLLKMRT